MNETEWNERRIRRVTGAARRFVEAVDEFWPACPHIIGEHLDELIRTIEELNTIPAPTPPPDLKLLDTLARSGEP